MSTLSPTTHSELRNCIKHLYEKYAGMLLGFLKERTGDQKIAEEHLTNVFFLIAKNQSDSAQVIKNWPQLRRFALSVLPGQKHSQSDCPYEIFERIYLHGESIVSIAAQLDQSEGIIRRNLRNVFLEKCRASSIPASTFNKS